MYVHTPQIMQYDNEYGVRNNICYKINRYQNWTVSSPTLKKVKSFISVQFGI